MDSNLFLQYICLSIINPNCSWSGTTSLPLLLLTNGPGFKIYFTPQRIWIPSDIVKWRRKVAKVWKRTDWHKAKICLAYQRVIFYEGAPVWDASYFSWRVVLRSLMILFAFIRNVTLQHTRVRCFKVIW